MQRPSRAKVWSKTFHDCQQIIGQQSTAGFKLRTHVNLSSVLITDP